MRRPIVFTGLAFTLGIAGQHLLALNIWFLTILLIIQLTVAIFIYISGKHTKVFYGFLIGLIMMTGALWFTFEDSKISQISTEANTLIEGEGTILTAVKKDENYYKLVVKVEVVFNGTADEKTIINYYGNLEKDYQMHDLTGRRVSFRGLVSIPDKSRNPGTFDYREYLKTVGIYTLIKCNSGEMVVYQEIQGKGNKILNYLSGIKGEITRKLTLAIGETRCGVIDGMMWGDVANISDDVMEQFRMNGTAHILSVSGIHVGLVYIYLNKLLLGRKNVYFDSIIIMLLVCYAAMAAFSPSVIRALTMIIIHIISKHTYCRYDMLCCGAAAIIFMLVMNPLSLFNIGFQLSFLAIFALAVLVPYIQKIHGSFITPILAIQFGLSPMTAYVFNYFSLGSILANIPIIFIASLIIPMGLLTIPAIIFGFPQVVFNLIAIPMGYLIDLMLFINDILFMPGKSFFYVTSPSILFMVLYYFILFFFTSELFQVLYARKKYAILTGTLTGAILIAGLVNFSMISEFTKAELIFVDVGQGDCLHIRTKDGKNILIDGGGNINFDVGSKILMPYLLKNGVEKVDAVFVTHLHQDHYGGLLTMAKKGMIKKIYLYEGNRMNEEFILNENGLDKKQVTYLVKGDQIILDRGITIEVLSPLQKSMEDYRKQQTDKTDENEMSLILKVNYEGVSLLMTGDIDIQGEKNLINQYAGSKGLKSDILKVSHHGSKNGTSDDFLESVSPELAVIQVGKNNFGHPNPGVLEKIQSAGVEIFRNDVNGAIGISVENSEQEEVGLEIITMY